MPSSTEIRRRFLEFFEARGHRAVPSSSLVPQGDPTLLFTNAGMNQFKNVFLGQEKRDYVSAVSVQKCVRAGGKHNDLENVGFTHRHHTFFEMLGNFSFGDYFKDEAIPFAWELLTKDFGLPEKLLYATVYEDDDQAEAIWRQKIGLPADKVFRLGATENFWAMGDTGPCGPCSELHYDQGPEASEQGHKDCRFPCDCGRYVEIWNLVFMQFERDASGKMTPLPRPSIDTGAGLERLAAVLQGKISNYDTDLFQPIIAAAGERAGVRYGVGEKSDIALRILADHARASTFLIHDGVLPANEGRGYVLRKIIRRALRHGRTIGLEEAFLYALAGTVTDVMAPAYPELNDSRARVAEVLKAEEDRFAHTLALALNELEKSLAADPKRLAGAEAFRLYDTFGLPLDVIREIAGERHFCIDEAGFETAMAEQRERARASWKGGQQASASGVYQELVAAGRTRFDGYESTDSPDATIRALLRDGQPVASAEPGAELEAVLDHTPFYAASGGQIGDRGIWTTAAGLAAEVLDTYAPVSGLNVHRIRAKQTLQPGEHVEAMVDVERRDATRRNHTATHLLHAALRQVLGTHVKQAGSVVEPGRLRFDFTHFTPISPAQLEEIERLVNTEILKNAPVETRIMPLDEALATGAMALFGEKYQQQVRVVTVPGFSQELCGGTHTHHTGDIGLFKIVYETSVAAGIRRIEAVTGLGAYELAQAASQRVHQLTALLHTTEPELVAAAERSLDQLHQAQAEIRRLKMQAAAGGAGAARQQREIQGIKVVTQRVDDLDRAEMRVLADQARQKLGSGVVAFGGVQGEKFALIVAVTPDLAPRLPAGAILKALPGIKGGGRPELAEAGGADPAQLDSALSGVFQAVESNWTLAPGH
ncbi:MAG: alanine--tRNA ligase [Acidobacteria bacterium]|nr:MAG: alanine--tRNA ligase [Acidobacteriota bacterium]